jgi:ribosome-associated protein
VRDIELREDMIRLGQLLKLADVVAAGSDVKILLASGEIQVNGQVETRRGRQLARGDVVATGLEELRLV